MLNARDADPVESRSCITGIRDGEPLRRDRTAWTSGTACERLPTIAPDPQHSGRIRNAPLVGQD